MIDGIPNRPLYFYQKDIIGPLASAPWSASVDRWPDASFPDVPGRFPIAMFDDRMVNKAL